MEPEHGAGLAPDLVLGVGRQQERHHGAGGPGGGLDDVGHVALTGGLVEVLEPLPRRRCVGLEVEVGSVGDALELVPSPREEELHVRGTRRVVGQLVGVVVAQPELRLGDAQPEIPAVPLVQPVLEPVLGLGGRDEVLHLHLLELTGPEDEVLRGDLVAERLAHLGDPEGWPLARGLEHVGEVDEHPLGGLRPEVGHSTLVLDRAGVGLEHQVEGACLGELGGAAGRADPADLVLAPPLVAVAAVHQWVGEVGQVARGLPYRRWREDGGI